MNKIMMYLLLLIVATLCVVSCDSVSDTLSDIAGEDDDSTGWCDKKLSESEASQINTLLVQEITGLFGDVDNSRTYPDYRSPDGSVVVKGEYTVYPYYFNFKFTFMDYHGTYIDISSGSCEYTDEVDDTTAVHYWKYEDGYFNVELDNEEYEAWWDFMTYNRAGVQYTDGTFKICESEFQYGGTY